MESRNSGKLERKVVCEFQGPRRLSPTSRAQAYQNLYLITDLGDTMSSESDDGSRSLLILYATETGNAQDAADFIARQCRRIAFQCRVADVETFSLVLYFSFLS